MLGDEARHAALNHQGLRSMLGPGADALAARALAAVIVTPGDERFQSEGNEHMGWRDEEAERSARNAGYGFASDEEEDALPPYHGNFDHDDQEIDYDDDGGWFDHVEDDV